MVVLRCRALHVVVWAIHARERVRPRSGGVRPHARRRCPPVRAPVDMGCPRVVHRAGDGTSVLIGWRAVDARAWRADDVTRQHGDPRDGKSAARWSRLRDSLRAADRRRAAGGAVRTSRAHRLCAGARWAARRRRVGWRRRAATQTPSWPMRTRRQRAGAPSRSCPGRASWASRGTSWSSPAGSPRRPSCGCCPGMPATPSGAGWWPRSSWRRRSSIGRLVLVRRRGSSGIGRIRRWPQGVQEDDDVHWNWRPRRGEAGRRIEASIESRRSPRLTGERTGRPSLDHARRQRVRGLGTGRREVVAVAGFVIGCASPGPSGSEAEVLEATDVPDSSSAPSPSPALATASTGTGAGAQPVRLAGRLRCAVAARLRRPGRSCRSGSRHRPSSRAAPSRASTRATATTSRPRSAGRACRPGPTRSCSWSMTRTPRISSTGSCWTCRPAAGRRAASRARRGRDATAPGPQRLRRTSAGAVRARRPGTHQYRFVLYALAAPLGVATGATGTVVRAALAKATILGQATLEVTYRRG